MPDWLIRTAVAVAVNDPSSTGPSNNYLRGDAQDLSAMLTHQDPATFMPRSEGRFEVLNSGSSSDLAFWTGRQVATMDLPTPSND